MTQNTFSIGDILRVDAVIDGFADKLTDGGRNDNRMRFAHCS